MWRCTQKCEYKKKFIRLKLKKQEENTQRTRTRKVRRGDVSGGKEKNYSQKWGNKRIITTTSYSYRKKSASADIHKCKITLKTFEETYKKKSSNIQSSLSLSPSISLSLSLSWYTTRNYNANILNYIFFLSPLLFNLSLSLPQFLSFASSAQQWISTNNNNSFLQKKTENHWKVKWRKMEVYFHNKNIETNKEIA